MPGLVDGVESPMSRCGHLLASGRTSEVFLSGDHNVVKVPRPGVPPHWARVEAGIAEAVHGAGVPCPEVRGLVEVDGRESIVFERIEGPSLWQAMLAEPAAMASHVATLVDLQRSIHRVDSLAPVPRLVDRIGSKILAADGLGEVERTRAARLASSLPQGSNLCHGDLHPANVLLSRRGPVVIDWFDAAAGSPVSDLVRTSLLVRPLSQGQEVTHLPGADAEFLAEVHRRYVGEAVTALIDDVADAAGDQFGWVSHTGAPATLVDELLCWEQVLAAGRLAEHTTADRGDLLSLLGQDRASGHCSPLGRALRDLGFGYQSQ